ncbi:MAG: type II toxin-antitoxin system VapC family toxin [Nitrospirae bacterium]|nr:type II toxin-antitoxin system VapC family toxin [Nitrospirota bacterium]
MPEQEQVILYWDASALLSALINDEHSFNARRHLRDHDIHVVSSLACVEFHAVLSRIARHSSGAAEDVRKARTIFQTRPWFWSEMQPDLKSIRQLSEKHPLKGADLWHLAACLSLRTRMPELLLLTYDKALQAAAEREGFPAL